ncbi:MAG: signal peptidase I [bacterium]|nr:signal peptidase I [bacterium]
MEQYSPPRQNPSLPGPSPVLPIAPHHRPPRDGLKSILTTVLILLIAPVLALSITAFIFQSYEVEGPSMEPTLETQDRLIIWKAGRTWSRLTKDEYIPQRGSVIVFVKRGLFDFSTDKEKQLIKRIIGLPGDRIVVDNGEIKIFNSENRNGFNPDKTLDYGADIKEPTEGNVDITVGAGEIFVMGDNRDNSLDSRSFGTVPVIDIVGTLSSRILPISDVKKF